MRDHNYFDRFARDHKMRPQGYVDTDDGRILLADSEELIVEKGRLFYRTGYAIHRDGLDLGNYNDYGLDETGGSHSDRQYRLNEATMTARQVLRQLVQSGFYDDGRKKHFSA